MMLLGVLALAIVIPAAVLELWLTRIVPRPHPRDRQRAHESRSASALNRL
jgi:hypothetical protein